MADTSQATWELGILIREDICENSAFTLRINFDILIKDILHKKCLVQKIHITSNLYFVLVSL